MEDSLKISLAAVIHDWGKFAQRSHLWKGDHAEIGAKLVDKLNSLFPNDWLDDLRDAVAEHHQEESKKEIVQLVRIADHLSAKERIKKEYPQKDPEQTPLISVFSTVDIGFTVPSDCGTEKPPDCGYHLKALSLEENTLFPESQPSVNPQTYETLWEKFEKDVTTLSLSGKIDSWGRFTSFLALLRKYLTFVPSATPWEEDEEFRTFPDISLFNHLKTSAAIASCLNRLWWLEELYLRKRTDNKPLAYILRGDFSGIQDFIYRVARIEEDRPFKKLACRLRARSFYISILTTIITEWLMRKLELTTANILFEGGGHFDLLLPINEKSQEELNQALNELNKWFLEEFEGELGLVTVKEEVYEEDFSDLRNIYKKLEEKLALAKLKKWHNYLTKPNFLSPPEEKYYSCRVCQLKPLPETGICSLCEKHAKIGEELPVATHLAFIYSAPTKKDCSAKDCLTFEAPLNVVIKLLNEEKKEKWLRQFNPSQEAILYSLNNTDFISNNTPKGLGIGFRFLANQVPIAKEDLLLLGREKEETTRKGEGLDFEEIAEIGRGSKDLGILKADVDHLGFILSEGLHHPSISRLSTFSDFIEIFFSGWINILCQNQFVEWKKKEHPWTQKISGLFYVVYSGGDDLLLIGPWQEILELAHKLNDDFTKYTCDNPNITLSAGISIVKPYYPVHRFISLVATALNKAKEEGRKSINFFDKSFSWKSGLMNYELFLEFARRLSKHVTEAEIPRGLLHDLGRLHQLYSQNQNKDEKPLLTPALYYTMVRRLKPELCQEILPEILEQIRVGCFKPLIQYILLATREEGERCR